MNNDKGFLDDELMAEIKPLLPPESTVHPTSPYKMDIHTIYHINDQVIDVGFNLSLDFYRAGLLKHVIQKSAQQAMGFYINSLFEL